MKRSLLILAGVALLASVPAVAGSQSAPPDPQTTERQLTPEELKLIEEFRRKKREEEDRQIAQLSREGIEVKLADIGGFRGAQTNVIMGYGLIVGLDSSGDSNQTPFTSRLLANALSRWGALVDADKLRGKNIAAVSITAELPAFAAPGRKIDVTVQSIGDAKSLEGGFLLPAPLGPAHDPNQMFVLASGAVSLGGFNAGAGSSSVRKNHQTVGRIPNGGDIQRTVQTQVLFPGNKAFFDLETADFTTAKRVAAAITQQLAGYTANAQDGVTIEILIPDGVTAVEALAKIESVTVKANLPSSVVINERTGTIIVGGNVRLGPAIIAHGGLQVRIEPEVLISQPNPLAQGTTTVVEIPRVTVVENPAQVGLVAGAATIGDLARILQTLQVSARDVIAILQALADQGALKARIRIQ